MSIRNGEITVKNLILKNSISSTNDDGWNKREKNSKLPLVLLFLNLKFKILVLNTILRVIGIDL